MTKEKLNETFLDVLAENCYEKKREELTDDKRLWEDLGLDNLDVVEFVMSLEETFNITIQEEDVRKCDTVGDYRRMLMEKPCYASLILDEWKK